MAPVHINDILIYGKTVEGSLVVLEQVLSQMVAYNVRLKLSKCFFGMDSIKCLGYIFDENGVRLSDSRVQDIRDVPEPTSVKGIQSFIRMVQLYYFRNFMIGLSSHRVSINLENATQKCFESSFVSCIKRLTLCPLGKHFTVKTDHKNQVQKSRMYLLG